jgi:hypothetical protein
MSDLETRAAKLFEAGKLLATTTVVDVGICNAQIMLSLAAAIVIGIHAGHHGKEPEVDIAEVLASMKKGISEMRAGMAKPEPK